MGLQKWTEKLQINQKYFLSNTNFHNITSNAHEADHATEYLISPQNKSHSKGQHLQQAKHVGTCTEHSFIQQQMKTAELTGFSTLYGKTSPEGCSSYIIMFRWLRCLPINTAL